MLGPLPVSVEWLLWAAAALVAVWILTPLLFMMLGLTRVGFRILGGPETIQPTDGDPQYDDLFERLRELGFEPLGSRQEFGWFANWHWHKAYPPGRVFGTPARDCFVTLYRIFDGQPWRLSFHTVFSDGSLVSTANQMPDFRIDMTGYRRWGSVTPDLAELLRLHRGAAEHCGHGLEVARLDMEGVCAAITRHSGRYLRSKRLELGLSGLVGPLLLAGLWATLGWNVGFDQWEAPAAIVLAVVLYKVLQRELVRKAAKHSWDRDRERAWRSNGEAAESAWEIVPGSRDREGVGAVQRPRPLPHGRGSDRARSRRLGRRAFRFFHQQAGDALDFLAQSCNHLFILLTMGLEPLQLQPAALLVVLGRDPSLFPRRLFARLFLPPRGQLVLLPPQEPSQLIQPSALGAEASAHGLHLPLGHLDPGQVPALQPFHAAFGLRRVRGLADDLQAELFDRQGSRGQVALVLRQLRPPLLALLPQGDVLPAQALAPRSRRGQLFRLVAALHLAPPGQAWSRCSWRPAAFSRA